jgi:hypothetical protein
VKKEFYPLLLQVFREDAYPAEHTLRGAALTYLGMSWTDLEAKYGTASAHTLLDKLVTIVSP